MNTLPPQSWMRLCLPPERFVPLEVRLNDDSVRTAIWTGAKWWSNGQEVTPLAWRPVEAELVACAS